MKIYLDWNILNGIKNGHFNELKSIIEKDSSIFTFYSTAHISDIVSASDDSIVTYIKSDLDFISSFTKNLCLYNDGKEIKMEFSDPYHFYENEIEGIKLIKSFSINYLTKNNKIDHELKEILQNLSELPLYFIFNDATKDTKTEENLYKLFPGLKDDLTLKGMFNSVLKLFENLNEKETYKDLKNEVKKIEINQGKLTSPKYDPFKVINDTYSKLNTESPLIKDYISLGKNAPLWFDEISQAYILLDIHGYYSDAVSTKKKKKKTFRNTKNDAFHTAYASCCDVYITQDNKNNSKAKAVFKNKEISTYVFKPNEFIKFYSDNLHNLSFQDDWNKVLDVIQNESFTYVKGNNGDTYRIYISDYQFFKYFNKITIIDTDDKERLYFMMGKELPTNCLGVVYEELIPTINLIADSLGKDDNGNKLFNLAEVDKKNNWDGRYWTFDDLSLKLIHFGKYFQFYVNYRFNI